MRSRRRSEVNMAEVREILEKGLEGVEPPPEDYSRLMERARRRDRRSRLAAAVVAGAMAAAGIGLAVVTFGNVQPAPPEPVAEPEPPPPDFGRLEVAWTARPDLGRLPPVDTVAHTATKLIIGTDHGLIAFGKACGTGGASCQPAWTAEFPSRVATPRPIVAGGVLYQAGDQGVYAFDPNCGAGGAKCEPLWIGRVPEELGQPIEARVVDDVVIATVSRGDNPGQTVTAVAFSVGCASPGRSCDPAWTGVMGTGTIHSPGSVVGDTFYQQIGSRLVGFEARCGDGSAVCEPSFVFPTGGHDVFGPVRAGDELIVAFSDGSVYAFPFDCAGTCQPLWRGETGGYMESYPVVAGEVVAVTRGSNVVAFPIDCRDDGGSCDPAWRFDAGGNRYPSVGFAEPRVGDEDPAMIVAADWQRGDIWILPSDCSGTCEPAWGLSTGGEARGVQVLGDVIFLEIGSGEIRAFPLDCETGCEPIWSADVEGRLVTELLVDGEGVYAVSVDGELGLGQAIVTTFREGASV
jgi:hypothetical protein